MGLSMSSIEVKEVILKTSSKEIVIENPEVAGGKISEKTIEGKITIPEEDIQLVAQQANVSLEEARAALEQTKGDLAQAILLLSQR
jgi:nascent polypeptide-associated complex subunit alpha